MTSYFASLQPAWAGVWEEATTKPRRFEGSQRRLVWICVVLHELRLLLDAVHIVAIFGAALTQLKCCRTPMAALRGRYERGRELFQKS